MAHLPQDDLPGEFDVVVDGTGLVQSILAAALSRAGKSVLHLDRNTYYGELWGSLMHREMQQWVAEHRSRDSDTLPPGSRDQQPLPTPYTPCEGERVLEIVRPHLLASVTNLVELIHTQPEDSSGVEGDRVTGEGGSCEGEGGNGEGTDEAGKENGNSVNEPPPTTKQSSKVTWQSLEPEWRCLNFDLKLVVHVCGYNFFIQQPKTVKLCKHVYNTTTYLSIQKVQLCKQQKLVLHVCYYSLKIEIFGVQFPLTNTCSMHVKKWKETSK